MSDDLGDLRASVRGFLTQHAPVRAQLADTPGLWQRLTGELGLTGLAVAEQHGGSGASFVEAAVVLHETGRCLLRAPVLSTTVAAVVLAGAGDGKHLRELAEGPTRAALDLDLGIGPELTLDGDRLTGTLPQVVDAEGADLLLLAAPDGLRLVQATSPGLTVTPLDPMDPTRPQARVGLAGVPSTLVGGPAAVRHARDLLHVALAAESVGAAQRCLELTVAHLLTREQFGRPLGSFQALRHRVADLTVAVEAATSTTWYAARAAAGHSDDLAVVAPLAKAVASEAFVLVASESLQLHGGIGFTWEHDLHLFFKRATTTALLHGDNRTLRREAFARSGS